MRCWGSREELADPAAFGARVAAEFPTLAPLLGEASRREVLRLMGASLALAGLGGCDIQPDEAAIPYVTAPEYEVPGKPRYYATATLLNGYAVPVLVETHEGRPTKVEGNPDHPLTRGTTDIFAQAAVLGLYDPDRSAAVTLDGRIASFDACQLALTERARELEADRGRGLAILTGTVTSPTLAAPDRGAAPPLSGAAPLRPRAGRPAASARGRPPRLRPAAGCALPPRGGGGGAEPGWRLSGARARAARLMRANGSRPGTGRSQRATSPGCTCWRARPRSPAPRPPSCRPCRRRRS